MKVNTAVPIEKEDGETKRRAHPCLKLKKRSGDTGTLRPRVRLRRQGCNKGRASLLVYLKTRAGIFREQRSPERRPACPLCRPDEELDNLTSGNMLTGAVPWEPAYRRGVWHLVPPSNLGTWNAVTAINSIVPVTAGC